MDDIKRLLGKRIKEIRTKKGMTQEELAEITGMGERNLSKIECGVNFVSAETLSKLSDALSIDPKVLFDFNHLKDENELEKELIEAIKTKDIDIRLLYKFYQSLKH